jgi:hypothetical protein
VPFLCVDSSAAGGIDMSWNVKALAYGYVRIVDERDEEAIQQLETGLRKLAEAEIELLCNEFAAQVLMPACS